MLKNTENKQGGFLELIVLIIIALVLMQHYGVTLGGVINWFIAQVKSVF